jgi:prepilin-type N-terminal cleavage/methylation domain-containing protein
MKTLKGWRSRTEAVRDLKHEDGFTLIELLVAMSLAGILMALSAGALRNYWLTQALNGATEDVISQLRQVQQRTDAESHPLVYGVRFEVGSSNWAIVKYDPKSATTASDDTCTPDSARVFADGVVVSTASFDAPSLIDKSKCPEADEEFAFFYARGTATEGSVTLRQLSTGKTRTVSVLPLTGRVRSS